MFLHVEKAPSDFKTLCNTLWKAKANASFFQHISTTEDYQSMVGLPRDFNSIEGMCDHLDKEQKKSQPTFKEEL